MKIINYCKGDKDRLASEISTEINEMVISNSSWVKVNAAPALVYTDSGKIMRFPPLRTRGSVPRALTFSDYNEWPRSKPEPEETEKCCQNDQIKIDIDDNVLPSTTDYSNGVSFLVTSDTSTSKSEIDDPPEAYESFEFECIQQQPFSEDGEEFHSMSTPTEHYSNLMKEKLSYKVPKLSVPLSSGSDGASVISSPLVHSGSTAYLSIDELVDIYTKKMENARATRAKILMLDTKNSSTLDNNTSHHGDSSASVKMEVDLEEHDCQTPACDKSAETEVNCVEVAKQDSVINSTEHNEQEDPVDHARTIQLMVFDIQLLMDKLDELGEQDGNSSGEKSLCIKVEELENLVVDCCKTEGESVNRYQLDC